MRMEPIGPAYPDLLTWRLILDCGHHVDPPHGPFGSEGVSMVGDRRRCRPCFAALAEEVALAAADPSATTVIDPVIDPKVQEPATSDRDAMSARIVELAVERDDLRRGLIAYGHHAHDCEYALTVCTCGFTDAMRPLVDPPATSEPRCICGHREAAHKAGGYCITDECTGDGAHCASEPMRPATSEPTA